jgi:hypothetical protein
MGIISLIKSFYELVERFRHWPFLYSNIAPVSSEKYLNSLGYWTACHAEGRGFEPRHSRQCFETFGIARGSVSRNLAAMFLPSRH